MTKRKATKPKKMTKRKATKRKATKRKATKPKKMTKKKVKEDAIEFQRQNLAQEKRAEASLLSRMSKQQRLEIMDHVAVSRYLVGENEE
ncbi:MAG: hypothetical protein CMI54_08865 [Parcubacteria group bacterium]|nr:hypothetical protein [Parcubacteria group bacterium]|tara:strand:+ start:643 stop:909 length:267 start_codon:yes stop_codon:yes gene_type:complete